MLFSVLAELEDRSSVCGSAAASRPVQESVGTFDQSSIRSPAQGGLIPTKRMDDRKAAAILVHSIDESRIVTGAVGRVPASGGTIDGAIARFEQSSPWRSADRVNRSEAGAVQIQLINRAAVIVSG